jgi:dTDP-glucose 4,6-dehydratase
MAYDNSYSRLQNKTAETRFCNVVGKRQDTRKVLPRILHAIKTGQPMPVHNGGGGYREFIWVENIPPVIDLILEKGNRVYNITTNDGFTVKTLIKKVEEITNKKVPTISGSRPGMDMKYQLDATRIKELGWAPIITFEEGLKKYLYEVI